MPGRPVKLIDLPEELLLIILSDLRSTRQRNSLCALALTCQSLNRITTPFLYENILLTPNSFRYLRPLAFLLFTSTSHSSLVRSITVSRAYGGNLLPWPKHAGLETVLKAVIQKFVKEEQRDEWLKKILGGKGESMGDGVLETAGLIVRCCSKVGRMGWDGWDLVDPNWKEKRMT